MKIVSSAGLLAFYKAYLEWSRSVLWERHPFFYSVGLCTNLYEFQVNTNHISPAVCSELRNQIILSGLEENYPFNLSFLDYQEECFDDKAHLNEKRIRWVKDRIADCEE